MKIAKMKKTVPYLELWMTTLWTFSFLAKRKGHITDYE